MLMIIDGKQIAEDIYKDLASMRERIERRIVLGIVIGEVNPVIASFVRIKSKAAARLNIEIDGIDLLAGADTSEIQKTIQHLARETDGIIVQLPLPEGFDTGAILSAIPKSHDVDGINPTIPEGERVVHAPVAEAVGEILSRAQVTLDGKQAIVVGQGRLVGAPTAALLKARGCIVSTVTLEHGSLEELKTADIVVLGAGNPGFIKPAMLKKGVVLIDAGTSESEGKIQGDADSACAEVASVFTPVPGGVGPIAVAMIFKNLLEFVYQD